MARYSQLLAWLAIDSKDPGIALAQFHELQRQVPLLYSMLVVNAIAVAFTHYGLAPDVLTIGVLAPLIVACIARMVMWLKSRGRSVDAPDAIRHLRRTVVMAAVLSVAFVSWALWLDGYGGPYERGHVSLFIAITVVGCIFCLMHLPQAAVVVMVVVTVPYLFHYLRMDNKVFYAIALNILLVSAVMLQVLFNSYRGFGNLVRSQVALAAKQAETARLSDENARLAHTDPLTGLPNRRYFLAQLAVQIETSRAGGTQFAIGILDLDGFKDINDTHGHMFGDRLLAEVGQRLSAAPIEGLVVTRLGGDEFGFLLAQKGNEAVEIGQRLCDIISVGYQFDDKSVLIGCSCGLAVFPDAGDTVAELFDRSDYALYHSKTSQRGQVTLYANEHEVRIRSERAIEAALRGADFGAEMEIYLQPIVADHGGAIAVEALARWTSPSLGRVAPDVFIAIAERAGLIHTLTLALFAKSLAALESLPPSVKLSFNLSAHDVTCPRTVLALMSLIGQSPIDPQRIVLELTETAVMRNFEAAAEAIRLLRALGVKIALDDFGTGYSSLGYLHRLPIDEIKVDRSFVAELAHPSGRNIVASIVGLCRNLQLECVIEGVEDQAQLAVLRELGCTMFQGYFFGRPMPVAAMADWIGVFDGQPLFEPRTTTPAGNVRRA